MKSRGQMWSRQEGSARHDKNKCLPACRIACLENMSLTVFFMPNIRALLQRTKQETIIKRASARTILPRY